VAGEIALALLLKQDAGGGPEALADVLGDGFLCRKNSIYRRVRHAVKREGYRLDGGPSALWHDYRVFPLLCLPEILASRTIPYIANREMVERLAARCPRTLLSLPFLVGSLTRNHVLHESCHAAAHGVLERHGALLAVFDDGPGHGGVWRSAIEEGFATATERLAWLEADTIAHRVFLALNSYLEDDGKGLAPLRAAAETVAGEALFVLLFLSFTAANFGVRDRGPAFARVAELTGMAGRPELASIGEMLSEEFREMTASAYYGLSGAAEAYAALSERPFAARNGQGEALLQIGRTLYTEILANDAV